MTKRAAPVDGPTATERSLRARAAVYSSWAKTGDRAARTAPARAAFADRFEREVDPDAVLPRAERAERAAAAKAAYMANLSRQAAQARRIRKRLASG